MISVVRKFRTTETTAKRMKEDNHNRIQTSQKSESSGLIDEIREIIERGRSQAYASANQIVIQTYWNIGRRIVVEEQQGKQRAEYGKRLIANLAEQLSAIYGSNYSKRNLEYYRQFYLCFKDFEIVNTRVRNLTWSHIRRIMNESDPEARVWYLKEASEQMWSVRTLSRNINTQYYGRRMACYRESLALPKPIIEDNDTQEYIKSPVIAEFLGFRKDSKFDESKLEQALIDNLEQFIMELGRGFAFVDRQKHIVTDTADYYIDLVFYNIKLKRYVLFELKTHELFTESTIRGKLGVNALESAKSLYDIVVVDSQGIEKNFAEVLEKEDAVEVYTKLPRGFYINTPMGHYNPDWVVAFKEGSVKHIYFIAETKGKDSVDSELRGIETGKIECARRHFAAISNSKVVYGVVKDYQSLYNLVTK